MVVFWRVIRLAGMMGFLMSCGPKIPFKEVEITAASLENIQFEWQGAGFGVVNGTADMVVTATDGTTQSAPVLLEGGLMGAVLGAGKLNKIFSSAAPIRADFGFPGAIQEDELLDEADGGIPPDTDGGILDFEDSEEEEEHPMTPGDLMGSYSGLIGEFDFLVGAGGQVLVKNVDLKHWVGIGFGYPATGLGMAFGLEWIFIGGS